MKKQVGSVRFRFYKQKTKKIEPNPNRKKPEKKPEPKPEKTKPKPVWTGFCSKKLEPNRTKTGWFDSVSVWFRFFLKIFSLVIFFNKNQIKLKIIASKLKSQERNSQMITKKMLLCFCGRNNTEANDINK